MDEGEQKDIKLEKKENIAIADRLLSIIQKTKNLKHPGIIKLINAEK